MPRPFSTDFILEPEKETTWQTGWLLSGYTFTKRDDGWLLTLKCTSRKGVRKVAFIHANTVLDCYQLWYSAMVSNSFTLKWRDDKYNS